MMTGSNPIIYSDFPDPDVIRVGDTYYMASTTMHYMPGCDILRSYDLINWELLGQVFEGLADNPRHRLEGENNIYGKGMWAPTLRCYDGTFYLLFAANDTHETYLFEAQRAEGSWKRRPIGGFYYDSSLFFDEDGRSLRLMKYWQFNHAPHGELYSLTERPGAYRLRSGKICKTVMSAYNTLTQRMTGPDCAAQVTLDGSGMKDGDYAGLCAFQGCYGMVALTRQEEQYSLVMLGKPAKNETIFGDYDYEVLPEEYGRVRLPSCVVQLRLEADFEDKRDMAEFFWREDEDCEWRKLGVGWKLYFKMDHFTGCRFGLAYYSTEQTGGTADFLDFHYFNSRKS